MAAQAGGTVTILFTDLVNSTELLQRAGDERAQRILRAHHELLKQTVARHGGHEVKWLGDGLMVAFPSAANAVRCAIAMQQASAQPHEGELLRVRVGLNAGEALRQESDYFGTPVVVARRLCDRAEGGQILCSALVPALLAGREEFRFRDVGALELKGIAEPVAASEVMSEPETPAPGLARMPFVGRQKEMARLRAKLAETQAGRGGVMTLAGEPGIGKTRVAEEFAQEAQRQGAEVLWGRCYEGESSRPYGPFVEAIEQYARSANAERLAQDLGPDGGLIANLVPALRERLPGLPQPPSLEPEEERFRLLDAAARFFGALCARAPLLLVLEDLHWASAGTMAMLRHVARAAPKNPFLVLGTYRDVELGRRHPFGEALADLQRETAYERIALKGLPVEEVAHLLEALAQQEAPGALVRAISSETDGNPLFIREVLLHLVEEGKIFQRDGRWTSDLTVAEMGIPEGVRQAIGRRLSRLSEGANRALAHASVLGRNFDFDVLQAFTEMGEEALLEALEEALVAQVIEETKGQLGASYRFTHELVKQTLYGEISIARRQRLHLRAGRALESARAGRLDPIIGEVARHFREGGDADKAIQYSLRAGEAAQTVFAYEEAVAHWEAALALMEEQGADPGRRAELLERLGALKHATGIDYHSGIDCTEKALRIYEQVGGEERAARVHAQLGWQLSSVPATLQIDRALEHFRAAEPVLRHGAEEAWLGRVYAGIAIAAVYGVRAAEGLAAARRAVEIAQRIGDDDLIASRGTLGVHLLCTGRLAEGFEFVRKAWETADRLDQPQPAFLSAWGMANGGVWNGDPADGLEWVQRELAKPRASRAQRTLLLDILGWAHGEMGDLAEARRIFAEVGGAGLWLAHNLAMWEGEWDRAQALNENVGAFARHAGNRILVWWSNYNLARLHRVGGVWERADVLLQEALGIGVGGPHVTFELRSRVELALLYMDTSRSQEAEPHVDRCREIMAAGEDWRGLAGRVALAEGAVAAAEGRLDEAVPHFERALETFRRYTLPWDEAEALYAWGNALLKRRKRARAREKLEAALAIYEKHGAGEPWKERVRAVLRRVEPAPGAPVYPDNLTEREVEVLRLVAAGRSNSEIADALVLSLRTVERHITNIYAKIGAHGKADATRYALDHGLTGR